MVRELNFLDVRLKFNLSTCTIFDVIYQCKAHGQGEKNPRSARVRQKLLYCPGFPNLLRPEASVTKLDLHGREHTSVQTFWENERTIVLYVLILRMCTEVVRVRTGIKVKVLPPP